MFPQHPPEFWKKSSSLMQCWEFMNKIKDQYINANNAEACIQSVFYENHLPKNIDNPQFCVITQRAVVVANFMRILKLWKHLYSVSAVIHWLHPLLVISDNQKISD